MSAMKKVYHFLVYEEIKTENEAVICPSFNLKSVDQELLDLDAPAF